MKKLAIALVLSTVALALMAVITAASSGGVRTVRVEDKCDPATFNEVLGEGVCVGDGNVTFAEFLEKLNPKDGGHGAWRFHFGRGRIDRGETLAAINVGGEPHTFTEVAVFGGGCVDELNGPLGLVPVAECGNPDLFPGGIRPSGANFDVSALSAGTHRFQCLIHPWMRLKVEVRAD